MNKNQKKLRKQTSIDLMNQKKVEEWEKNDVYKDISIYEWVELKVSY
mgnify:CR=1 FL=1